MLCNLALRQSVLHQVARVNEPLVALCRPPEQRRVNSATADLRKVAGSVVNGKAATVPEYDWEDPPGVADGVVNGRWLPQVGSGSIVRRETKNNAIVCGADCCRREIVLSHAESHPNFCYPKSMLIKRSIMRVALRQQPTTEI